MYSFNHAISLTKATVVNCIALSLLVSSVSVAMAQSDQSMVHVDPPNWWVGMHNKQVELLLNAENLAFPLTEHDIQLTGKQVKITSATVPETSQYVLINLAIGTDARISTYR